jgi:hypothetical protein
MPLRVLGARTEFSRKSMRFFFLSVSDTSLWANPIALGSLILSCFAAFVKAKRSPSRLSSTRRKVSMARVQASLNIVVRIWVLGGRLLKA